MGEYGKGNRPSTADPALPQSEEPRFKGGSVAADREWAQNRIANFLRAQQAPVMRKAESGGAGEAGAHAVSQPGEPAEKEADAVADRVAGGLHGGDSAGDKAGAEAPKEAAAPIAAKLDGSVIQRMPKHNENDSDDDGGPKEKGKSFRGGKKKDRDNWYGFNEPDFQNWWHRVGKQEHGGGRDIEDRAQAQHFHDIWVKLDRPRGGK